VHFVGFYTAFCRVLHIVNRNFRMFFHPGAQQDRCTRTYNERKPNDPSDAMAILAHDSLCAGPLYGMDDGSADIDGQLAPAEQVGRGMHKGWVYIS